MSCFYLRQGLLASQLCPQPHAHEACTTMGQDEDPEMVIHVSSDKHDILHFILVTVIIKKVTSAAKEGLQGLKLYH